MTAYYNEHDPKKAAWLRELIAAGVIAPGIVDERSIEDVLPSELVQYTQCHFFAGIGIWSYALRQAGWPDDRPVWTGSCPCQPFSAAGKRAGTSDERHLWPAFYWLIQQCQPDVVFGEQVASKDGLAWLDIVWTDLEATNYAIGPLDLCAAGVGAPHIRQRLYFVAYAQGERINRITRHTGHLEGSRREAKQEPEQYCRVDALGDSEGGATDELALAEHAHRWAEYEINSQASRRDGLGRGSDFNQLGDADEAGSQGRRLFESDRVGDGTSQCAVGPAGPTNGYWRGAEWIYCRDGKYRPTQPGISPLVDGAAERVVRGGDPSAPLDANNTAEARALRFTGYGDAIVAPLAMEFIQAAMEWGKR